MPSLLKTREWLKACERSRYYAPRFASLVGIRLRTLQRLFRKEFGCTISDWLNQVRLQKAKVLARRGMTTTSIAQNLGFKSVPTFCREFKRTHGRSVTQFQKNVKKK